MAKILVVDDVLVNRKLICKLVKKLDSSVELYEAGNGNDALKLIDKVEFSVIVMDVMMPQLNGIEALEIIKNEKNLLNTSIIICSAVNDVDSIQKALDLGALDYFTKPLNTEQIKVTIPLKIKNAIAFYENKKQLIQYNEMFKAQMQLAEEVQRSTIIESVESTSIKMDSKYIPCDEIGGDMFAIKQVSNKTWFIIADITGHGVAAAMMSMMIKVVFNYSVTEYLKPSEVLNALNRTLFEIFPKTFPPLITAFAGFIQENKLCYANAGHPYPIFYKKNENKVVYLEQPSFALGFDENTEYEDIDFKVSKNDFILLFTDGLYDIGKAEKYNIKYDVKLFIEDYLQKMNGDKEGMLDEIVNHFKTVDEDGFDDDVAVVSIEKVF